MTVARWLGWLVLALMTQAAPAAEPAQVELTELPDGTEWLGWNESGEYKFRLPQTWRYETRDEPVTRALFDAGRTFDLPGKVTIEPVLAATVTVRANGVRGLVERGRLTITVVTDRLDFGRDTRFHGSHRSFGSTRQTELVALSLSHEVELELSYEQPFGASFDRVEVRTPVRVLEAANGEPIRTRRGSRPAGAAVARFSLAGLAGRPAPERLSSLGLWSRSRVSLSCRPAGELTLQSETTEWIAINGQPLRQRDPVLEAPHARVRVRKPSFAARSRRELPCRITETSGRLVHNVRLEVAGLGSSTVAALSKADSPDGLSVGLAELRRARGAAGTPELGGLASTIEDYLLPLWYGLWYDEATGKEVVRDQATLDLFVADYAAAATAARPKLKDWLDRQAQRFAAGSLSEPDQLLAGLSELVQVLCDGEPRQAAWWSVYLSDLFSELGGGPVTYWSVTNTIAGAPPHPERVTLPGLRDLVQKGAVGTVLPLLRDVVRSQPETEAIQFDRLGPGRDLAFEVLLLIPRGLPPMTCQASIRLSVDGRPASEAPLEIEVLPSLLDIALFGLAAGLPAAAVIFLVGWLLHVSNRRGAAARLRGQGAQARFARWAHFLDHHGQVTEHDPPEAVSAAMRAFASSGVTDVLPTDLFAQWRGVLDARGAGLAVFLAEVGRFFGELPPPPPAPADLSADLTPTEAAPELGTAVEPAAEPAAEPAPIISPDAVGQSVADTPVPELPSEPVETLFELPEVPAELLAPLPDPDGPAEAEDASDDQ